MNSTETVLDNQTTDGTITDDEPKVIVFNDQIHTFDEVIGQLIKANAAVGISMSHSTAEGIANEVHQKGKSVAYGGEMSKCLVVSHILEEIALHTQIEM